jgi:hypothetical protein
MQMVHVLEDTILEGSAHGDVVEDGEVLHVLAQPDAPGVWTDRDSKLRSEQHHRQALVHAAEPARIELTEADRAGLHELLEHDAVLTLLAGRDADRRNGASDGGVA